MKRRSCEEERGRGTRFKSIQRRHVGSLSSLAVGPAVSACVYVRVSERGEGGASTQAL